MCQDAASGMEYLESKQCIHRFCLLILHYQYVRSPCVVHTVIVLVIPFVLNLPELLWDIIFLDRLRNGADSAFGGWRQFGPPHSNASDRRDELNWS